MGFITRSLVKKIAIIATTALMFISTASSCALFVGDPNDRNVKYEISEDKKTVIFYASADARSFDKWSFQLEDGAVIRAVKGDWNDGITRVCESRTVTGLKAGKTYIAFYIPSSKQDYTIIFGYNITVDALGQITVEEAESDSQIGKESQD